MEIHLHYTLDIEVVTINEVETLKLDAPNGFTAETPLAQAPQGVKEVLAGLLTADKAKIEAQIASLLAPPVPAGPPLK